MSELQQKRKRPWYTEDILYIIAEKLLARIPDGPRQARLEIDFCRQNPYTLFMGHNEMATRTIISQFAKFKRIVFYKQIKFRGEGEDKIEFYKNERIDYYSPTAEEFRGPYIVPKGMLEFLIENGKLRVDNIETCLFFPNDHSIDIKEFGEMNSLKAFCALFLGKQIQIPDGLNNNLMVKKFRVDDESIKSIQNNLETILAIDAVELEFHYNGHFIIDCSKYKSSIIAQNTTKIKVDQFHDKFFSMKFNKFAANFETFCSFLIRVCPNLNNLQFKIHEYSIDHSYSSIAEFTRNFYSIIKTMEAGIKSINIGNEHLQISIELIARFSQFHYQYDKLPIQSHDLFKLGTPFTIKNAQFRYIARSLECVDACGRIHKLQFKFIENRR